MHGLAEDGGAIVGQEAVLREDGCGIGRISEGDGEGCSGGDVVDGRDVEVSLGVDGDFAVCLGAVVDLCVFCECVFLFVKE